MFQYPLPRVPKTELRQTIEAAAAATSKKPNKVESPRGKPMTSNKVALRLSESFEKSPAYKAEGWATLATSAAKRSHEHCGLTKRFILAYLCIMSASHLTLSHSSIGPPHSGLVLGQVLRYLDTPNAKISAKTPQGVIARACARHVDRDHL